MGLSVPPVGGSMPASICSGVTAYQPTVELTCCRPAIETLMLSSMGYGNDQCSPGRSSAFLPFALRLAETQDDRPLLAARR